MLLEPWCATASPALPLPVIRPLATAVVTGVVGALRIEESATSTTSTIMASPIVQPLSS